MAQNIGLVAIVVAGKLIFMPLIIIPCAVLLGFRDVELITILTFAATPTAISAFPMSVEMGGDAKLSANTIAMSTILSSFTFFIWVYLLLHFNYI